MWRVALIVGVAVAASVPVLVAGVVLAITVERRRYRRYIRRCVGTVPTDSVSCGIHVDNSGDCIRCGPGSLRKRALETSPETWVTVLSSETVDRQESTKSDPSPIRPAPIQKNHLRRPLRSSIKKKRATDRQRLKRTVPLKDVLNSPLSAITENSDSSDHSAGCTTYSTLATLNTTPPDESRDNDSLKRNGTVKKRCRSPTHDRLARKDSTDQDRSVSQSASVGRSISFSSMVSPAPTDPLPQLPVSNPSKLRRLPSRNDSSHSSVDSVDSSELEATISLPPRPVLFTGKTDSQALKEFNFELGPKMRLNSPAHLTSPAQRHERAAATASMRASIRSGSETNSAMSVNVDRHMAVDTSNSVLHSVQCLTAHPAKQSLTINNRLVIPPTVGSHGHDPFITAEHVMKDQVGDHAAIQKLKPHLTVQQSLTSTKSPSTPSTCQNSTTFSDYLSSLQTNTTASALNDHAHKRNDHDLKVSELDSKRAVVHIDADQATTKASLPTEASYKKYSQEQNRIRLLPNAPNRSTPTTPDSGRSQYWRFGFELVDSPKIRVVASPFRSYNSPLLPSPKLSSAYVFPYPRRSEVRGPRRIPNHRDLPAKFSATTHQQDGRDGPNLAIGDVGSSDVVGLNKSVALLREYSSKSHLKNQLVLDDHEKENKQPRYVAAAPLRLHPAQSSSTLLKPSSSSSSTPRLLNLPSSSTRPNAIENLSVSQSLGSTAGAVDEDPDDISIWDDASVRESSPDPETQSRKLSASSLSTNTTAHQTMPMPIPVSLPVPVPLILVRPDTSPGIVVKGNTLLPPPTSSAIPVRDRSRDSGSSRRTTSTATAVTASKGLVGAKDGDGNGDGIRKGGRRVDSPLQRKRGSLYDQDGFLTETGTETERL